jgi:D-serine deaminase-like pyridoxal phosphate-dependent protein
MRRLSNHRRRRFSVPDDKRLLVEAPEKCMKRQTTRHGSLKKVGDVQGYEEARKTHGAVNGLNNCNHAYIRCN